MYILHIIQNSVQSPCLIHATCISMYTWRHFLWKHEAVTFWEQQSRVLMCSSLHRGIQPRFLCSFPTQVQKANNGCHNQQGGCIFYIPPILLNTATLKLVVVKVIKSVKTSYYLFISKLLFQLSLSLSPIHTICVHDLQMLLLLNSAESGWNCN